MRAKVSWYLCSVVGGIRGHRQEKWYAGWLCTTDRVHHYPWHCHVVRHANGYDFITFHPTPFNRIIAIGFAINPARDLGPRLMTAMVGYGRQGTALLSHSIVVTNTFFFLTQFSTTGVSTGSGLQSLAHFAEGWSPASFMTSSSTLVLRVPLILRA